MLQYIPITVVASDDVINHALVLWLHRGELKTQPVGVAGRRSKTVLEP